MATAQWRVYAYSTSAASPTSTACASPSTGPVQQRNLSTAGGLNYCLALGGGYRTDGTPLTAIQINYIQTTAHVVSSAASVVRDLCGASSGLPHINSIGVCVSTAGTYPGTPGGMYLNTAAAATMSATVPNRLKGLHYQFQYVTQNTQCTKCEMWSGNGVSVNGVVAGGDIYIAEIAIATPTWSNALTGARKQLRPNGINRALTDSVALHEWYVAVSVKATAVGLSTAGRVKIENTFQ